MIQRIVIADDHALLLEALTSTIQRCWPNVEISQAKDFPDVWTKVEQLADLCICDLTMPGATAIEGIKRLFALQPSLRVIAITGSADNLTIRKVMELPIAGLIPKTTDSAIVEAAIRLVLAGGRYFPESASATVAQGLLTPMQTQIMALMRLGQTNKEIARNLGVAPSTVKTHVDHILKRLGARNRVDACQKF